MALARLPEMREAAKSGVREAYSSVEFGAGALRGLWTVPDIERGIREAKKLEKRGGGAILNILGEHRKTEAAVAGDMLQYVNLIDAMKKEGLRRSAVSVKPTQFGFDVPEYAGSLAQVRENMWVVVQRAAENGIKVEMDMEDSATHDFTYAAYEEFLKRLKAQGKRGMLGLAVQANYHSTEERVKELLALDEETYGQVKIRLTKGIYVEKGNPDWIAGERETVANYLNLVRLGMRHPKARVAIASHRDDAHALALEIARQAGKRPEAQYLKGIRGPFKRALYWRTGEGYFEYVPIGRKEDAAAYGTRRARRALPLLLKTATDYVNPRYYYQFVFHLARRWKRSKTK